MRLQGIVKKLEKLKIYYEIEKFQNFTTDEQRGLNYKSSTRIEMLSELQFTQDPSVLNKNKLDLRKLTIKVFPFSTSQEFVLYCTPFILSWNKTSV